MVPKKQPEIKYTEKTFNEWIDGNAGRLKERVSLHCNFDEDAFQDAYLAIVTADEHESTSNYEANFIKAYRRFSNRNIGDGFTLCHPDELFFSMLPAEETDLEDNEADIIQNTIDRIRRHIQATYSKFDVKVFELKLAGCSFRDISATLGIGTLAINNIVKRISTETRIWLSNKSSKKKSYEAR